MRTSTPPTRRATMRMTSTTIPIRVLTLKPTSIRRATTSCWVSILMPRHHKSSVATAKWPKNGIQTSFLVAVRSNWMRRTASRLSPRPTRSSATWTRRKSTIWVRMRKRRTFSLTRHLSFCLKYSVRYLHRVREHTEGSSSAAASDIDFVQSQWERHAGVAVINLRARFISPPSNKTITTNLHQLQCNAYKLHSKHLFAIMDVSSLVP
mmetsp:Transcript_2011/g.7227  ORF Transcript_2011/g.7227 Transcript_2011/m.7227 type:complete len:208 (-) Transcript_2011:3916-4539(-)